MKPVITKKTHYTVMLMRDDGAARSFRIRGGVLRFCILFFCLLLIAGGTGIAVGVHYRYKAWTLTDEARASKQALDMARVRLEELSGVETIASSMAESRPKTLNTELTAQDTPTGVRPTAQAPSSDILTLLQHGEGAGPHNATTTPARNATATAARNATERNATTAVGRNATSLVTHNAGAFEAGNTQIGSASISPQAAHASAEPTLPQISSPQSPVRILNFLAQNPGSRRLRVRFDLISQNQQPVSGQVRYRIALRNGTMQDLDFSNGESARFFAISRMKQMDGTARLPQGVEMPEIKSVDVQIRLEDGTIFHDVYPVSD